jgi:hypothetical protein
MGVVPGDEPLNPSPSNTRLGLRPKSRAKLTSTVPVGVEAVGGRALATGTVFFGVAGAGVWAGGIGDGAAGAGIGFDAAAVTGWAAPAFITAGSGLSGWFVLATVFFAIVCLFPFVACDWVRPPATPLRADVELRTEKLRRPPQGFKWKLSPVVHGQFT